MYNHLLSIGDINIRHVVENSQTMERIHTLTSILAGVLAGLFNTNLYSGIFTYLLLHLVMIGLVAGKLGSIDKYFLKKSDILGGLGSGIPVFMCAWMIIFNVVYTLWRTTNIRKYWFDHYYCWWGWSLRKGWSRTSSMSMRWLISLYRSFFTKSLASSISIKSKSIYWWITFSISLMLRI